MDYNKLTKSELIEICEKENISFSSALTKEKLIELIIEHDLIKKKKDVNTQGTKPIDNNQKQNNQTMMSLNDDEPYVRGYRHEPGVGFMVWLLTAIAGSFVLFISFFYWPLIRKCSNVVGEYIWAWVWSFNKWLITIGLLFYTLVFFLLIPFFGIIFGVLSFFYWKSVFKAFTMGRRNREYYINNYH